MKPLVTTVNALGELAAGLARDAIPASLLLLEHAGEAVDILLHVKDKPDEQRIILVRKPNSRDRFTPEHPADLSGETLNRVASFAERVRASGPVTLPRGWHQYKHNNLIAFFAVPNSDDEGKRWIAELMPGEPPDIVL